MALQQIVESVEKFAPLLGKIIAGTNPIADVFINLIAKAFGVPIDQISNAINNDPNAAEKLKDIELSHQDVMLQSILADRQNARQREIKMVEVTGRRDWVVDVIAVIVIVAFFILCALDYFYDPADDHILIMLIGQASGAFVMVLSYYFGSSKD